MRGRLWVVYQCQKNPEIELQLNMHSWVCFIIYNTYFWMLYHSSDGSPILLIPFNQPPSFKILWTAAARQAGAHGARPSLSLQHLSQKSNTWLRNLEFQSWVNWKQKGKPSSKNGACTPWGSSENQKEQTQSSNVSSSVTGTVLVTGDTERVFCPCGAYSLVRKTDNKQENSRMELMLWRTWMVTCCDRE